MYNYVLLLLWQQTSSCSSFTSYFHGFFVFVLLLVCNTTEQATNNFNLVVRHIYLFLTQYSTAMSKPHSKAQTTGPFSVTLDNLIGDSSHISCERSAFVINGLTVVSWIYYNPKVPQKAPIIVCHGGPSFPHNYLLPMKLLTEFGYPVVFYDQAGW